MKPLIIYGKKVRLDEDGYVCITDIHKMSGLPESDSPWHWKISSHGRHVIECYTTEGRCADDLVRASRKGGTYVHPLLAIDYAGWLTRNNESWNLEDDVSDAIDDAGLLENCDIGAETTFKDFVDGESDTFPDVVVAEGFGEEAEDCRVQPPPEDGNFRFDPSDLIEVTLGALSEHMTALDRAKLIHDLIAVGTGFHVPITIIADETIH